ncbi:hypothetical protein R6Q59_024102 [Mikania micrantha]
MNPLCCIAPVSIEKDRTGSPLSGVEKRESECQLGFESSARSVRPASFSVQLSSVGTELENMIHEAEDCDMEVREKDYMISKPMVFCGNGDVVAGILYKWMNYGKGWRSRWFTLEDGVLSYYKTHGPDKIMFSPGREKEFKVIGDESIRYMRKCSNGGGRALECLGLEDDKNSTRFDDGSGLKVKLIMTDYSMPGITGFELLKKIKVWNSMHFNIIVAETWLRLGCRDRSKSDML